MHGVHHVAMKGQTSGDSISTELHDSSIWDDIGSTRNSLLEMGFAKLKNAKNPKQNWIELTPPTMQFFETHQY